MSLAYVALGETDCKPEIRQFRGNIASNGGAKNILQRLQTPKNEAPPVGIRTSGYTKPLVDRHHSLPGDHQINQSADLNHSFAAKQHHVKAFAQSSRQPQRFNSGSFSRDDYSRLHSSQVRQSAGGYDDAFKPIPLSQGNFYVTKKPAEVKCATAAQGISKDSPKWFKVTDKPLCKNADVNKSYGFDGTITELSRICGWVTVTPVEKNRQKRFGRYGPFAAGQPFHLHNESSLSPQWMQIDAKKVDMPNYGSTITDNMVRDPARRTWLVDSFQKQGRVSSLPADRNIIKWGHHVDEDSRITGKIGHS